MLCIFHFITLKIEERSTLKEEGLRETLQNGIIMVQLIFSVQQQINKNNYYNNRHSAEDGTIRKEKL